MFRVGIKRNDMPQYDLAFGKRLAEAARLVMAQGLAELDAQRTVAYLSLLATEIILKALLEEAGRDVQEIQARRHNLSLLLGDIGGCDINGQRGTTLRSQPVDDAYSNATVGTLIEAESHGASHYPNQIRYGDRLAHYPAHILARLPDVIYRWAGKE